MKAERKAYSLTYLKLLVHVPLIVHMNKYKGTMDFILLFNQPW